MPWLAAAAPAIIGILGQIGGGIIGNSAASSAASKIYSMPVGTIRTPNSSLLYGNINIDPGIRQLRASLLGQYQNYLGPQYRSLLTQAGANSPDYINSIVDPYAKAIAEVGGNIMQNQQNRNIRGSSFANSELGGFARDAGSELSRVTARAINSSINEQAGLLDAYGRNVLAPQDVLNEQQLEQELKSLGLGYAQVQALLEQSRIAQAARAGGSLAQGGGLMGIGNILSNALPGILNSGGGAAGGGGSPVAMGGGTNFSYAG